MSLEDEAEEDLVGLAPRTEDAALYRFTVITDNA